MSKLESSPIRIKSFQFACEIVHYCDVLKNNKDFEIASQLLRSGTSIGANTREAQRGVSTKDLMEKCEELMRILVAIIKNS
ncbi:four helix bundle protein [Muricauda sp. CAU 1633]|uniref:four helix bundle protein n=1 Tax=Allomuricauda sp. CAU 1633 TaxID=2816036 RepID=UPI001A906802|nr:four helix bundle protein [Muricauda sp. CAU 1633]MBO0320941.1 four helix bundle protein [Muricauda sp. CAU 1633]